ncbi:MAG TPA: hypothetical protein VE135_28630 [Pyrinomonadaceae bacterium]|nr:hypothetical protein [Pyrinomonadaceae bacterium]
MNALLIRNATTCPIEVNRLRKTILTLARFIRRYSRNALLRPNLTAALFCLLLTVGPHAIIEAQETSAQQTEGFSENVARRPRRTEPINPAAALRSACFIYVRSISVFVTAEDIENKLRKHPDFKRYGMVITRQEADADLILEVRRSVLTKFVFSAVEPRTLVVVASGKLSSLGGTVDGKVAKLFMKQVVAARQ